MSFLRDLRRPGVIMSGHRHPLENQPRVIHPILKAGGKSHD